MKERRKQVNGRSRHRVISCKNHLIVATSVSVSRWIKKRIASKELKLLRISFSQTNKNESLLSVDKRKKRKEEKKMRREKWREVKKGKRNARRALFNSIWRPKLRSTNDTPLDLPRSFELSVESLWYLELAAVCRIFALFCRCLLEECRRAEPDRKAGLTWQLSCPCLLYDNSAIFAQTRRTSSKEQTNY